MPTTPRYVKKVECKRSQYLLHLGLRLFGYKHILGYWIMKGLYEEKPKELYKFYVRHIRSKIYTTNAVESINSGLEYMRMEHGGYFASLEMLDELEEDTRVINLRAGRC